MADIKQVKLKQNGATVYPQTITDAVAYKTDSEAMILTDKLKGIDSDIANIEFSQLNPGVSASPASKDVLYQNGVTQNVAISLTASKAVDSDNHFSDVKTSYKIDNGTVTTVDGAKATVSVVTGSTPSSVNVYAYGTAKYRGSKTVNFGNSSTVKSTINFVYRSYIGYVDAADISSVGAALASAISSSSTAVKSKVSKNIAVSSESYSTVSGKSCYFVVAVPKGGNVFGVSQITQLGTLNAVLSLDDTQSATINNVAYKLYIGKSKHNSGSYNFRITTNGAVVTA